MASLRETAWRTGLAITVAAGSVGVPAFIEQQKGGVLPSTQVLTNFLKSSGLALDILSPKKAEANVNLNIVPLISQEFSPIISPDRPLTKEDLKQEFLTLIRGAEKYTLKDGSWRIQYPGEEISEIGWSRFARPIGEYIGATGSIREGDLALARDLIEGTHADIRRFNVTVDPVNSMINASFALRGLYAGKDQLLPKLNEYQVDYDGNIVTNGPLTMKQYWVDKFKPLLSDGDLKGNHASFRLVAKAIFSQIFENAPSLSSWGGKDVKAIRDSYLGGGVFVDKAAGVGHIDLYSDAIQANTHFLYKKFQGNLEQAKISWFTQDELRDITTPYLIQRIKTITADGTAAYFGRSAFSTAVNPPIDSSLANIASDFLPSSLLPRILSFSKQSLLSLNREADYILPRLTREASAGDSYINSVVATTNVGSAISELYEILSRVGNYPEANPAPVPETFYWAEAGILAHITPEGTPTLITARSSSETDPRYWVRIQHPDFRQEGSEAWLGDRPVVYGIPTIRYKEGMPGNLNYLTEVDQGYIGLFINDGGWVYYQGTLTEFADGLGKKGRKTDILQQTFIIPWFNHVITINKFTAPPGKTIEGDNETSLPLPVNKGASPTIERLGNALKISFENRSIFSKPLLGGNIAIPDFRFGGPKDQRNAFKEDNVASLVGSRGSGQKEIFSATDWVYKKDGSIDLQKESGFVKILQQDSSRVVLEIGGKKIYVDFQNRYSDYVYN